MFPELVGWSKSTVQVSACRLSGESIDRVAWNDDHCCFSGVSRLTSPILL